MTGSERTPDRWFGEAPDFTIARGLGDINQITRVRDCLAEQSDDRFEVDRVRLDSWLGHSQSLSKSDAEVLFTGLVLNGAATQTGSERSFADYSFVVDRRRATAVLEAQRIARMVLDDVGFTDRPDEPTTELTATFPPRTDERVVSSVRPLSDDLRRLFFEADSIVRIANPYFDPTPSIVGDIASLADRGVTTNILTREARDGPKNLASSLNAIYEKINPPHRHRLNVRDLYERDQLTGKQAYATHAKIAIADRDICYLGSANLTDTSLSNNFELGVLLRGENVLSAIDVFDAVFDLARPVELPL